VSKDLFADVLTLLLFRICKDSSKKFCPSCGNPTLLRTSVTTTAASPDSNTPAMTQVHLKKNFQYRNRGTMYSIPLPKPGKAKGGGAGNTIILREDQVEFQRGVKREEFRIKKEDKKVANALAAAEKGDGGVTLKSWADPDWMPDMLLGKSKPGSGLPVVGYGRRNPNEVRKTKK
jgi:RNA-binding protein NOB1